MINDVDLRRLDLTLSTLLERLLDRQVGHDRWEGRLASSALSTATAVIALETVRRADSAAHDALVPFVQSGISWLVRHQNADGGWGDTVVSRSNISTTVLVWAALSMKAPDAGAETALARGSAWLRTVTGDTTPNALRAAILQRYGKDKTFSVPILTVLAIAGKLGADTRKAWRVVPQLPFELAACPHTWFQHLRLPVVSYALPALVAIGQVRHHFAPTRNILWRQARNAVRKTTHDTLRAMQPESGGYLEATPLTSFVVMSLAAMGRTASPVVEHGSRFLVDSMREDGSWPIDTNLATWVTTLAVSAIAAADVLDRVDVPGIRRWLLRQQSAREHPFTHAAAGGWAWTPLAGGVPDADDTSGALAALRQLGPPDADTVRAASAGVRWLLGVQNHDGGVPTFCRGWGALPFDRSTPEITANALRAWTVWRPYLDAALQRRVKRAIRRGASFLAKARRKDGAWVPLWFGNESAPNEENPTYGTARVLIGLNAAPDSTGADVGDLRRCARDWLLDVQNDDGGWGGDRDVASSIEETGLALAALCGCAAEDAVRVRSAVARGAQWLIAATACGTSTPATPIGLYFARLWYFEELYPLVFAIAGLGETQRRLSQAPGLGAPMQNT